MLMKWVRKFQEVSILSKLKNFVTDDILTQLYYSLVYPFLTYGLVVWGNTYATTLKPIVTLQKQTLRIIITLSKPDVQSSPIFSQLGLIEFMDLVMQTAVFMFQYYHNL